MMGKIVTSFIFFATIGFVGSSVYVWYADRKADREWRDSMATERHREKRMLDWKADSLVYEINNSLDSLSVQVDIWKTKANKYDSIERNKSRNN